MFLGFRLKEAFDAAASWLAFVPPSELFFEKKKKKKNEKEVTGGKKIRV